MYKSNILHGQCVGWFSYYSYIFYQMLSLMIGVGNNICRYILTKLMQPIFELMYDYLKIQSMSTIINLNYLNNIKWVIAQKSVRRVLKFWFFAKISVQNLIFTTYQYLIIIILVLWCKYTISVYIFSPTVTRLYVVTQNSCL